MTAARRNVAAVRVASLRAQNEQLDSIQQIFQGLCAAVRHDVDIDADDVIGQLRMSLELLAQARGLAVNNQTDTET